MEGPTPPRTDSLDKLLLFGEPLFQRASQSEEVSDTVL